MTRPRSLIAGILVMCVWVSSCSGGPSSNREEATGKGAIRALHAISDLGPLTFLIEEMELADIDFKESSGITEFDDLSFAFNFDIQLPANSDTTRLASLEVEVQSEFEYTFALTGTLEEPRIILWEQFRRDWESALTEAEENDSEITILDLSFGHLAGSAGELDVYIDTPGVAPLLGNQRATLSFGEFQQSIEIGAGEYQIVITPVGEPSEFIFASDPFTLVSATSVFAVVMDGDPLIESDLSVRLLGEGAGTEFSDINAPASFRVAHAAFSTDALDVVIGDDFANPVAMNVEFGELTTLVDIASGELNLNITPAGHTGAFLAEETILIDKGQRHTFFLTGLPGELDGLLFRDQNRRLSTHAVLRVYQGSERLPQLDFYRVPIGSDISLLSPTIASISYLESSGYQRVVPDTYDLVFTQPGTKTVVAGPLRVDLAERGIYDLISADSNQTDVSQLLFLSDE